MPRTKPKRKRCPNCHKLKAANEFETKGNCDECYVVWQIAIGEPLDDIGWGNTLTQNPIARTIAEHLGH